MSPTRTTRTTNHEIARVAAAAFAPIHKKAFGVAIGVALGTLLALFTAIAILRDAQSVNGLPLLAEYFYGYTVTWRGVAVIFVWGLGVGFVAGWFVAFVRNLALAMVVFARRAEIGASTFLDHL